MNRATSTRAISKILSANDTGETGAHQAGILIQKDASVLAFFPTLDNTKKNPRVKLSFEDGNGNTWNFVFIYYNSRFFGGTRNEYRLTCMTPFLRSCLLKSGDEIILYIDEHSQRYVTYRRANRDGIDAILPESREIPVASSTVGKLLPVLRLGNSWRVIKF